MLLQTVEWIRSVMLARLRGSPDLRGLDTSRRLPIWRLINATAYECRKLAVDLVSWSVNCIPTTATGVWLRRWATAWGVAPIEASRWIGLVTLYADAGLAPPIASGLELVAGDSVRYRTTNAVAAGHWSGPGGSVTVAAESITLGSTANKDSGTALTVVSPPAGVLSDALLGSTTTTAVDDESEDSIRRRLRNRLSGNPGGGNAAQYRQWALEAIATNHQGHAAEAIDAAVYPRWDDVMGDRGTLTVALFGPVLPITDRREVSADCCAAVADYIASRKASGADVTVESVDGQLYAFGLEVTVRPKPGYEADWVSPLVMLNVDSTVPAALRVNLDADPQPYIRAGDRVVFYCGATGATEQETVVSVGANYVILDEWPEYGDPVVASDVYPGGVLWQPVYDAVLALHDALGPGSSDTAGIERWPIEGFERPSTVNLSDLYAAVDNVPGVGSSVWTAPAADVTCHQAQAAVIKMRCAAPTLTIAFE